MSKIIITFNDDREPMTHHQVERITKGLMETRVFTTLNPYTPTIYKTNKIKEIKWSF